MRAFSLSFEQMRLGSFSKAEFSSEARRRSITTYVDNGLGEGFGSFLRKIVPNSALNDSVQFAHINN